MSNEKDPGFKVVDKRHTAQPEEPKEAPKVQPGKPVEGPGFQMREEPQGLPPINFSTFVLSLASNALFHLGLAPDPESGQTEKNLPLAQQTIDILAMLEEKTRGNLAPDEQKLIGAVLYDLRMRFVEQSR